MTRPDRNVLSSGTNCPRLMSAYTSVLADRRPDNWCSNMETVYHSICHLCTVQWVFPSLADISITRDDYVGMWLVYWYLISDTGSANKDLVGLHRGWYCNQAHYCDRPPTSVFNIQCNCECTKRMSHMGPKTVRSVSRPDVTQGSQCWLQFFVYLCCGILSFIGARLVLLC